MEPNDIVIDRTLSESDNIVTLIKANNPDFSGSVSSLTVELQEPSGDTNTSVLATSKSTAPTQGSQVFHYNRLDLGTNGLNENAPTEYQMSEGQTENQVVNAVAGLANILTSGTNITFTAPEVDGIGTLQFTSKVDSLIYLPETSYDVILLAPAAPEPEVPEYVTEPVVTVQALDGGL